MKDYRTHLEALRKEAVEAELIRDLTTVPQKRELFAKLAVHLNTLAGEVERAMAALNAEGSASLGQATPQAPQLSRIDPARGYTPDAAGGTRKPSGWPCLPQQRRSPVAHGGDG